MNDNGMSPADVAAVVDNNRGGYAYPVYPYGGGFGGGFGSGYGDGGWLWLILILAFMNNGWGNGFGGNGNNDFAWLSNGQKDIMTNTNNGFDTLHLSNQIEGTRDSIHGISNQICNSTASVTSAITDGFYGAEIAANNRQMADMQQNFNNQLSTLQSFNQLNSSLDKCCCENRLATCQTQNIVQNEGNATRFADATNTRDIIESANRNSQAILDKLCQLELDGVKAQVDAKNDKISDLQRELQMADLRASQIAQTQAITSNIYNELKNCPVRNSPCISEINQYLLVQAI